MCVAAIVNDMSEVNIDPSLVDHNASNAGAALSRTDEKLVEMSNGGICCTLREDLPVEVRKLAAEGRFDYLLIEAPGSGSRCRRRPPSTSPTKAATACAM
jgi:G3E family GTPase